MRTPDEVAGLLAAIVASSDDAIVGASKIARDITEQKRFRLAAEEASRAKDEFLATLSVRECAIGVIAEDAVAAITPAARGKSIQVSSHISCGLLVPGDRSLP